MEVTGELWMHLLFFNKEQCELEISDIIISTQEFEINKIFTTLHVPQQYVSARLMSEYDNNLILIIGLLLLFYCRNSNFYGRK